MPIGPGPAPVTAVGTPGRADPRATTLGAGDVSAAADARGEGLAEVIGPAASVSATPDDRDCADDPAGAATNGANSHPETTTTPRANAIAGRRRTRITRDGDAT
jgi:hypothetical protein